MAINFFISRFNSNANRTEYLFLPLEKLQFTGEDRPIAPNLPGNNATNVTGSGGTNFILNLGTNRVNIQASGVLIDLNTNDLPGPLVSPNVFFTSGLNTSDSPTAKSLRSALIDFWADQPLYTTITLGWPEWGAPAPGSLFKSSADTTVLGVSYRLWQGQLTKPTIGETSGEINQYPYQFGFMVGSNNATGGL